MSFCMMGDSRKHGLVGVKKFSLVHGIKPEHHWRPPIIHLFICWHESFCLMNEMFVTELLFTFLCHEICCLNFLSECRLYLVRWCRVGRRPRELLSVRLFVVMKVFVFKNKIMNEIFVTELLFDYFLFYVKFLLGSSAQVLTADCM